MVETILANAVDSVRPLHCSFCGKPQNEVLSLVAGPQALICNECVAGCVVILRENGH